MAKSADPVVALEVLERQFDRIQFLFTRVDAKVNAVLAIASGQIAVASVGISGGDWKHLSVLVPAALFLVSTAFTMVNLYRCTFPEVKRGGDFTRLFRADRPAFSRELRASDGVVQRGGVERRHRYPNLEDSRHCAAEIPLSEAGNGLRNAVDGALDLAAHRVDLEPLIGM